MKRFLNWIALAGICAVGVVIWVFVYRDDGVDVANRIFPEGMDTKEKCLLIQKHWQAMEKMDLDSASVTNLISNLVKEKGSHLSNEQKSKLSAKLTSWFFVLKTGDFEDHLAFRQPDHWNVTLGSVKGIWDVRLRVPFKGGGKREDPSPFLNSLDDLPKSEWARSYYDGWTSLKFEGIRPDSIHFNIRKWRTRTKEPLKPFLFHPGNVSRINGNSFHRETGAPIKGYDVKPEDIVKKDGWIVWARFRAGYDTVDYEGYIAPVELALYWSPDEKRWLAGECLIGVVPDSYIPKGGWKYPEFEF